MYETIVFPGIGKCIPTAGAVVQTAKGWARIVGLFRSEEDVECDDPDAAAAATVVMDDLTPEQQEIAERNSERL